MRPNGFALVVYRAIPESASFRRPAQGVQYLSAGFCNLLSQCNVVQSMSRAGNPYDNAVMESFWAQDDLRAVASKTIHCFNLPPSSQMKRKTASPVQNRTGGPMGFYIYKLLTILGSTFKPGKLIFLTASKLLQKQFLCGVPARALCGFVRSTLRGLVRVTEGPRCFQWTAGTRSQPPDS